MHVPKVKLSEFHKVFKNVPKVGKKKIHVYPDGLIRIQLKRISSLRTYIFVSEGYNGTFSYVKSHRPNRDEIYMELRYAEAKSFDEIFKIIEEEGTEELLNLLLFNMDKLR